ncbi:MAG: DUF433 domain-containing protein [Bryobacteraceae bacterium]
MEERALNPFRNFRWIVADAELLGGKLAIRGTRFSVSFILSCLSEGMSVEEIEETYGRSWTHPMWWLLDSVLASSPHYSFLLPPNQ